VTDRDICMAAYTQGRVLDTIPVWSAMATAVHACKRADTLDLAERLMSEHQIHRLPIVDEDESPIGFVSLNDIARSAKAGEKAGAERAILDTLAAICQPRQDVVDSEDVNNKRTSRKESSRQARA
jgi:CBS domain-containing protein